MDRARLIYEIINKDNWEAIDEVDNFLYIFDRMPPRMKIIIDLKIQGHDIKEIAKLLNITEDAVRKQINKAKKRIFHLIT